ncbi:MAG TPA: TonB family protein [Pyrinomonadaceae bacterium]|nr:TonB family protein [Pyrinomonadaceae bacterium]
MINGKATNLPKPTYPAAARAVRASGAVNIQVSVDESGNVISVSAVSGHPLLRAAAEQAARNAKFAPTILSGQPVKITGVIVYNFTDPENSADINVSVGEIRQQTDEEKSQTTPEALQRKIFAEKLHVWLYALVERLQKGEAAPTANEPTFVRDGKAEIEIRFAAKTPEVMAKLRNLGFEISGEKDRNSVVGKIDIAKIASLAELTETQYILPKVK